MIVEAPKFNIDEITDLRHRRFIESVLSARPSEDLGIELLIPMLEGAIHRPPLMLAETAQDGWTHEDQGDVYFGNKRAEVKHLTGTIFSPGHWPHPHFFTWAPEKWDAYETKPYVLTTLSADLRAFALVWTGPTQAHWYQTSARIENAGRKTWGQRLCCPVELVHFYPMPVELRQRYLNLIPPKDLT